MRLRHWGMRKLTWDYTPDKWREWDLSTTIAWFQSCPVTDEAPGIQRFGRWRRTAFHPPCPRIHFLCLVIYDWWTGSVLGIWWDVFQGRQFLWQGEGENWVACLRTNKKTGARKLTGGCGKPGTKCVCIHKMVGPLGVPGVEGLARSEEMGK